MQVSFRALLSEGMIIVCGQKQLEVTEHHWGDLSPAVASVLNNLGVLCFQEQRFHEAESCLRRAVTITLVHEATPPNTLAVAGGSDDPSASAIVSSSGPGEMLRLLSGAPDRVAAAPVRNLALVYFRTGQLDLAEPLLRRHLASEERTHQGERVGSVYTESALLIPTLEILAFALLAQRKREEAFALYKRAREVASSNFGDVSPQAVRQIEHLALAQFVGGNFREAELLFREAHDTLVNCGVDPSHPTLLRMCKNMATAQCSRGPRKFR